MYWERLEELSGLKLRCQDPSAEFASTEVAEVSRFLARPGDFTYAVTEVTAEGQVRRTGMSRQSNAFGDHAHEIIGAFNEVL